MKALIVYDSVYGNTEKITRAIYDTIIPSCEVKVLRAGEANPSGLASIDLLIVGSPTHEGRATPAIQNLLNKVTQLSLKGINVAAFDTRSQEKLTRVFGNAAGHIAGQLTEKGGVLIVPPEGFFVTGTKGPLKEGELERAAAWAKRILEKKK
jgi:filamentous hemagglutinin family protein